MIHLKRRKSWMLYLIRKSSFSAWTRSRRSTFESIWPRTTSNMSLCRILPSKTKSWRRFTLIWRWFLYWQMSISLGGTIKREKPTSTENENSRSICSHRKPLTIRVMSFKASFRRLSTPLRILSWLLIYLIISKN